MYKIKLKRAYDDISDNDGYRVLVDRLWPRGIKKEDLEHDWWPKYIAPSSEIRKEFNHEESKFGEFKEKYVDELNNNDNKDEFLSTVEEQLGKRSMTLLYGAKDPKVNHAVVLKEWIEEQMK